jgi:hypothetical protein
VTANTIGTVLGPLVSQVGALRQTVERQSEEIADLREERGRHAAELERVASTIVALGEEVERLRGPSERPMASNLTPAALDPCAAWMDRGRGHAAGALAGPLRSAQPITLAAELVYRHDPGRAEILKVLTANRSGLAIPLGVF